MKRSRTPTVDEVFAETDTNAFLVALENWIARKLPAAPEIPAQDLDALMADLDRIGAVAGKPDADPAGVFADMARALGAHMPATAPDPDAEAALNHHERLFRAVFFFDSETYSDGVESYLTNHDERDVRLALEGLGLIGADETRTRLESLCRTLFGGEYPASESRREEIVESATGEPAALLREFARFHARTSASVDEALARWARADPARFA